MTRGRLLLIYQQQTNQTRLHLHPHLALTVSTEQSPTRLVCFEFTHMVCPNMTRMGSFSFLTSVTRRQNMTPFLKHAYTPPALQTTHLIRIEARTLPETGTGLAELINHCQTS